MNLEKLKSMVNESSNIVFFGGAGVSTESNIPDFRTDDGIFKNSKYKYSPEVMLSRSFFSKNPKDFFDFYKTAMIYKDAKPNLAHLSLANLEKKGKLKAIITQNIDGLHQAAGSKNVLELHGSIHRNYCMDCKKYFNLDYIINIESEIPRCDKCHGIIKPDVVLYEESLDMDTLHNAINYIKNADMLIVGGTSLVVYPAAGLVDYYQKDKLVLINKLPTAYDEKANIVINDSIGKILNYITS